MKTELSITGKGVEIVIISETDNHSVVAVFENGEFKRTNTIFYDKDGETERFITVSAVNDERTISDK